MQPDDEGGGHRVVKVRLKHIVSDQAYLQRFRYAVETMHELVEQALVFGKSLYLAELDRGLAANGGAFDREVASRLTSAFPIDSGQMEEWLDVVSSDLERRAGRPYGAEKKQSMERLHAFYRERATAGLVPERKTSCTNLSNPKGHAAAQMEVNYRNNVHCHFDKYVLRFAKAELTAIAKAQYGLGDDEALSRAQKRQLDADVRSVTNDLLTSRPTPRCRGLFLPWLDHHRTALMPVAPQAASVHWRFASQKTYPERWLPFMVYMNRALESSSTRARLLSPLPQRSSFVPAHVRIDTAGLIDLLVDCDDAHDAALLKASLESLDMPGFGSSPPTKYSLPGLLTRPRKAGELSKVSKAMLYVDLSKLVPPEQSGMVKADAARQSVAFKTAVWRSLTKIDPTNKHAGLEHDGLVFNNVIDTDGYSVSLHYVSRSLHGLTRFNGGFKALVTSQRAQANADKAKGATYATSLSPEERSALLEKKRTSLDPGKGALATVADGSGKTVAYTAAQRRVESGSKAHAEEHRRLLNVRTSPEADTAGELLQSIGSVPGLDDVTRSGRSCTTLHYDQYLRSRIAVAAPLKRFYRRPLFRAHRYDAYVGRRASEDRFVSRIKAAFGDCAILYGDWGRSPNLRHQPPSPGVGLRRRLCSYFTIILVHEPYTSSRCPRCRGSDITKPRKDRRGDDVHHLLQCANPLCSCRWWNRDVLGALNILRTGEHALRTGSWDPDFLRRDD